MTDTETVLAFDYGIKRIGVAVGQTLTHTATALEILSADNSSSVWSAIDRLVREWQPHAFVMGKPLHADDSETPLFEAIKDFGNQLGARYNCPVHYMDERLSSNAAENLQQADSEQRNRRGSSGKRRNSEKHIDHIAAKLILESWFSENLKRKDEP